VKDLMFSLLSNHTYYERLQQKSEADQQAQSCHRIALGGCWEIVLDTATVALGNSASVSTPYAETSLSRDYNNSIKKV